MRISTGCSKRCRQWQLRMQSSSYGTSACLLHGLCWGVQHAQRVCKHCNAACMDSSDHGRIIHRFSLVGKLCMKGVPLKRQVPCALDLGQARQHFTMQTLPSILYCVQVHTFQKDSQNLSITWCSLAGTCPDTRISLLMSTQRATGCVTTLSSACATEHKAASTRPRLWCTFCSHFCTRETG